MLTNRSVGASGIRHCSLEEHGRTSLRRTSRDSWMNRSRTNRDKLSGLQALALDRNRHYELTCWAARNSFSASLNGAVPRRRRLRPELPQEGPPLRRLLLPPPRAKRRYCQPVGILGHVPTEARSHCGSVSAPSWLPSDNPFWRNRDDTPLTLIRPLGSGPRRLPRDRLAVRRGSRRRPGRRAGPCPGCRRRRWWSD